MLVAVLYNHVLGQSSQKYGQVEDIIFILPLGIGKLSLGKAEVKLCHMPKPMFMITYTEATFPVSAIIVGQVTVDLCLTISFPPYFSSPNSALFLKL